MFYQKRSQLLTKPSGCHERVHLVLTLPASTNINEIDNCFTETITYMVYYIPRITGRFY